MAPFLEGVSVVDAALRGAALRNSLSRAFRLCAAGTCVSRVRPRGRSWTTHYSGRRPSPGRCRARWCGRRSRRPDIRAEIEVMMPEDEKEFQGRHQGGDSDSREDTAHAGPPGAAPLRPLWYCGPLWTAKRGRDAIMRRVRRAALFLRRLPADGSRAATRVGRPWCPDRETRFNAVCVNHHKKGNYTKRSLRRRQHGNRNRHRLAVTSVPTATPASLIHEVPPV